MESHQEASLSPLHRLVICVLSPSERAVIFRYGVIDQYNRKEVTNDVLHLSQFHLEPKPRNQYTLSLSFRFQNQMILQLLEDHRLICAPDQTVETKVDGIENQHKKMVISVKRKNMRQITRNTVYDSKVSPKIPTVEHSSKTRKLCMLFATNTYSMDNKTPWLPPTGWESCNWEQGGYLEWYKWHANLYVRM